MGSVVNYEVDLHHGLLAGNRTAPETGVVQEGQADAGLDLLQQEGNFLDEQNLRQRLWLPLLKKAELARVGDSIGSV